MVVKRAAVADLANDLRVLRERARRKNEKHDDLTTADYVAASAFARATADDQNAGRVVRELYECYRVLPDYVEPERVVDFAEKNPRLAVRATRLWYERFGHAYD